MKVCLTVLILLPIASVLCEIDYFWRDYNGDIPSDAIPAGLNSLGKQIYIGQGFFGDIGLLPGTIRAGSTNLRVTAVSEVFSTDKYVKILCSKHPNNFRWVVVNYANIPLLTNVHLVAGGVETNSIVHIGRARHEGDTEIGKIYNVAPHQGLALPNQEGSESRYQDFDILIYTYD